MRAIRRFVNYLGLAWAYVRLNLRAQLEYRGAFVSQVAAMFVNDCVWVVFWALFFTRFPVLRGWDVRDVIAVWAVAAEGFGLAHAVYGNVISLHAMIAKGEIDVWMLYPRALLPHMLLGKMNATAWGDALFGFVVYAVFVRPDAPRFALFALLAVASAAVFVGFGIATGSIGFYLGNSATLTEQWRFAMLTFSTYPATLFQGGVKLLLFTAIPAFFVNLYPVEALRRLSMVDAAIALAGAASVVIVGTAIFYHGLRRYESGNLLAMRE